MIQADETTVQVLSEPGKAATTDSFMWLYRSREWDPESQIILYEYQANRRQEHPKDFLGDFKGYLQTDGYAGYNSVTKREKDPTISVGCGAHARRYFCDASKAIKKGSSNAPATNISKAIAYADRSFAIERDSDMAKKPPKERMRIRKEKTLPVLDEYFKCVRSFDPDHIIKGKFRDGIVYSQNQEEALRAFLLDGRFSCSNNAAERSIKPFVISRKNFLFCKTPSGAKATATVFSLIETAKANRLDPFKYLVYIFEKLSQDEDYDLEQLMPWTESVAGTCKAAACE
ncbi:MAG: IS66 family transposase [Clostridia bacterium]